MNDTKEEILAKTTLKSIPVTKGIPPKKPVQAANEFTARTDTVTLRDSFAMAALSGLISRHGSKESNTRLQQNAEVYATLAYHYADKLMAVR